MTLKIKLNTNIYQDNKNGLKKNSSRLHKNLLILIRKNSNRQFTNSSHDYHQKLIQSSIETH